MTLVKTVRLADFVQAVAAGVGTTAGGFALGERHWAQLGTHRKSGNL